MTEMDRVQILERDSYGRGDGTWGSWGVVIILAIFFLLIFMFLGNGSQEGRHNALWGAMSNNGNAQLSNAFNLYQSQQGQTAQVLAGQAQVIEQIKDGQQTLALAALQAENANKFAEIQRLQSELLAVNNKNEIINLINANQCKTDALIASLQCKTNAEIAALSGQVACGFSRTVQYDMFTPAAATKANPIFCQEPFTVAA